MALDQERFKDQRRFYWFIVDGEICWNAKDHGFEIWLRTPLFGFGIARNWWSFTYISKSNRIWFGLLSRQPGYDGEKIYRWCWDREKVISTVFRKETKEPRK